MNHRWPPSVHTVMTAIDELTPNAPDLAATKPGEPLVAGSEDMTRRSCSRATTTRRRIAVGISAVAAVGSVVLVMQAFDAPSPGRVGPPPITPSTSTSVVDSIELPTTSMDEAQTTAVEPRPVDIAEAQRVLPGIDLSTTVLVGISVFSDGLKILSAPGLPISESPVGNDICLVISSSDVQTGQICASSADVGGLLLFTQEWTGGNAVVALTAPGVVTSIEGCQVDAVSASNAVATLTLCPELQEGTTSSQVRMTAGSGETLEVTLPVTFSGT